jgi:hypothetical protein
MERAKMAQARTRLCGFSAVFAIAALGLPVTGALAGPADAKSSAEATVEEASSSNEPIETCMDRWEADTHMTKSEWRATCIRMKKEREPSIADR